MNSGPLGLLIPRLEWRHYLQYRDFLPHLCDEHKDQLNINMTNELQVQLTSITTSIWFSRPHIPTHSNFWQKVDVWTGQSCVCPVMLLYVILVSIAASVMAQWSDKEHTIGQAAVNTARVNYQQSSRVSRFHCASQMSESRRESCGDAHNASIEENVCKRPIKNLHLSRYLYQCLLRKRCLLSSWIKKKITSDKLNYGTFHYGQTLIQTFKGKNETFDEKMTKTKVWCPTSNQDFISLVKYKQLNIHPKKWVIKKNLAGKSTFHPGICLSYSL